MVRICCAVMCGHDSSTCRMKVFPSDEKRAAVWQMNIGRGDWKRSLHSSVCECHFDKAQFLEPTEDGRRKLRPDAVPLVFPTHVLVIHNPDRDEKWHSPLPANSQPESPDKSSSDNQRKKVKREPAKLTQPMPKSVKARIEQKLSQQASHDKPRLRSQQSAKPLVPKPRSAKPVPRSTKKAQPVTPKSQSAKPMRKSVKKAEPVTHTPQLAEPMSESVKAKRNQKLPQPARHREAQPVKPMPKSVKKAPPETPEPQSAKSIPKSVKAKRDQRPLPSAKPHQAQPAKTMPKSPKAKENVESSWLEALQPALPQQLPATSTKISSNLWSVQLDHDYGQNPSDKMCERFCSLQVLEEIENQVLHAPVKNSVNESLQDGSSETANDSTSTDTNLPICQKSIVPSRIIVNPSSQSFVHPACVKNTGPALNGTARITRSMKMDTVKSDKSSEEVTLNANRDAIDDLVTSTCNGTVEYPELDEVSKDVKLNDKSTVYRLGVKRKAQMFFSKRPLKLLKTSQSPSSGFKSLLKSPDSLNKTSSPSPSPKSSVSMKDVSTEADLPSPQKPPISSKDVATETEPISRPKPSVSFKDAATGTEPGSPPRLPAQQLQPPEVWNTSDGNVALGSPGLLGDTISFLQFMLPEKWMALAENSGIHVVLLSGKTAKAIQRSVFVPFSGRDIELYVHSRKLSNDSGLFSGVRLETRPLTSDSLGDFVDGVVKIVQVFNSYKICLGVAEEEFLEQWRNYHDCILDKNLFGEEGYNETVRSIDCRYLAPKGGDRCPECDIL